MLHGTGRSLDGGRRQGRLATHRVDDPVNARGLGRSQQGAEVLRIFERIENQHEGRLAAFDGPSEDVVEPGELASVGDEGDALMAIETGQ